MPISLPITRRRALQTALGSGLAAAFARAAAAAPALKITKVETTYWPDRNTAPWWPHWTWLRLTTDNGLVGIGETYPRSEPEAAVIHSVAKSILLGRDPRDIEQIWTRLYSMFDVQTTGGAEMRALSAIDLALWDLLGKSLNTPVYRLIGGKTNPRVRLYNTCFPHRYDFNKEPEKIMREVLDGYGIRAIKVWPFDGAAARNRSRFITPQDIDEALNPVRKLREAFGDKIEILIEFHSNWNVTSAVRIAKALEPYKPMWLEDMLLPGNFDAYRQLAQATSLPLTVSERIAGRMAFQRLIDSRAAQFIMFDVCWCGGLTEARKIAAMADTAQLPFAPHTAGGPMLFYASTHLSTAAPNLWIQESCQRFYEHDWPAMLENPLVPSNGSIEAPELPGFGMNVKPEVWKHPAAINHSSTL
jgi:L-alanine-DL-glutamate epimerase-like enolase superfamily enzyme